MTPVSARNIEFVGHTDQAGRGDGVQVMVTKGHAFVGRRYYFAPCHWQGFTDHVRAVIDMKEPTRPEVVGRWWLPGMHAAGGETPSWTGKRYALHHAVVAGNLAYAAWRDGGMTILDV